MLILPPGHAPRAARPLRIGRRERWMIGTATALLAALVVVLVVSFTAHQRTSGHGCVDVSAATVIGGSELYRCGAAARALCTQPGRPGREFVSFQRALADACRKAGLPMPFEGSRP
jgi:hypothetical protein